jgi:hypothetical protein
MERVARGLTNVVVAVLSWILRRPRVVWRRVREFDVLVLNSRSDISTAAVIERFDEALGLIAAYQPVRYKHLTRDVERFVIRREAHRGHYDFRDRYILTELTFLARRDIGAEVVASSILHEGVHARIHRRALRMAGTKPGREERICRKAELAFGEALPAELSTAVLSRAREFLALPDEDLWVRSSESERRAAIARADGADPGAS